MDLNLVQTFVRVAEAQSFSSAARILGLPTSSVSRAVSRLEAELGVRLLERNTRHTSLTAVGRAFYESALSGLNALDEGIQHVAELQGDPRGEVRMTAPMNLDDGFWASQLAAFARTHPRVQVSVALTNRTVDLVAEGFDLALRVSQKLPDSSWVAREVGRFDAWLIASPEYVARRGRPARPRDLASHDCVLLSPRAGTGQLKLAGPRGEETVEVHGTLAADDMQFARQLVLAGAGIGLLPLTPGTARTRGSEFTRVLPDYVVRGPSVYVMVPTAKRLPLRVRLLRDFLINAYGQLKP